MIKDLKKLEQGCVNSKWQPDLATSDELTGGIDCRVQVAKRRVCDVKEF